MVIKTLLALVVALGPLQDDLGKRIDRLIGRLGDDSVDARDEATRELSKLANEAIPHLKKRLESLDPESRQRVKEAIQQIETRQAVEGVLPPLRRVTLNMEDRTVGDVLDELRKQTHLSIDSANASVDGTVSIELKDATPFQAFDELCRKAGGLSYDLSNRNHFGLRHGMGTAQGVRVRFINQSAPDYPVSYARHYCTRVTSVSLQKSTSFRGAQQNHATLMVQLMWTPDVKPESVIEFRPTRIEDDQGRSLLPERDERLRRSRRRQRVTGFGRREGLISEHVQLTFPEADARKIAIFEGVATLLFPKEVKTLRFENPAEAVGETVELEGMQITLKAYRAKKTLHSLTLEVTGNLRRDQGEQERRSGMGELPFSYQDVTLVTESGAELMRGGMSGGGGNGKYTLQISQSSREPEIVTEIRIPCVLSYFKDKVKFEFKDIDLPK